VKSALSSFFSDYRNILGLGAEMSASKKCHLDIIQSEDGYES